MTKLSKLSLGTGNAETEPDLGRYFIATQDYEVVKADNRWIVLGERGSGKSALFHTIFSSRTGSKTLVLTITPNDHSWKRIVGLAPIGSGGQPTDSLDTMKQWEFLILSYALQQSWEKPNSFIKRPDIAGKFLKQLEEHMDPTLRSVTRPNERLPLFIDAITRILKTLPFSIKIKSSGEIELEVSRGGKGNSDGAVSADPGLRRNALIQRCYEMIDQIVPDRNCIRVMIDQLDEHWRSATQEKASLIGLFLASYRLRQELKGKLHITIFIRNDMYEALELSHDVKYFSYKHQIRWSWENLRSMLAARIRYSSGNALNNMSDVETIYSLCESRVFQKTDILEWMSENLVPRPRDIIYFFSHAINLANERRNNQVAHGDLEDAYSSYSAWRLSVLKSERSNEHDLVIPLLDSFQRANQTFTVKELELHLASFKRDYEIGSDRRLTKPKLIRDLLNWGVIGIRDGRTVQYIWDVKEAEELSPSAGSVFVVHPSLAPKLKIQRSDRPLRNPRRGKQTE